MSTAITPPDLKSLPAAFQKSKAWPVEQAREIAKRLFIAGKRGVTRTQPVTFETGYGPSGLPHIGTFGEVVRTTMVRHAFHALTDNTIPTRLICVSDDMDGMRKVPGTVPNPEALEEHLQKPLTEVPDPFGTHDSYGAHMNARLRAFLDGFGFEYEFASATALYRNGTYDPYLIRALERFDDIMAVMLPTLGEERQATYSPFLPISPTTGRVLYVPMKAVDAKAGTITFEDEDGTEVTQPVTDTQDWLTGFDSGYLKRAAHMLPRQGDRMPWLNVQNYKHDQHHFIDTPVAGEGLEFSTNRAAALQEAAE